MNPKNDFSDVFEGEFGETDPTNPSSMERLTECQRCRKMDQALKKISFGLYFKTFYSSTKFRTVVS
jgi:hypothetical protein